MTNMETDIINRLREVISGDVLSDDYSKGMYATDASIYQITPLAIVLPRNKDDVIKAVAIARENMVTILPRSAGTSLAA